VIHARRRCAPRSRPETAQADTAPAQSQKRKIPARPNPYYNRTIPLPDILGTGIYAGASLEAGQVRSRFDGLPSGGTIWSGSVFLAADTFAGPAYFGIGASEAGRWSLYLLLGAP
jgi:hypothetical protein